MQSKHDKIRDLFLQALELATPEERAAFLSSACGADAHLRAEVERMLSIRTQAGDFFEPFENQDAQADKTVQLFPHIKASSGPLEECGSIIGRYKLLEQIGEGGFGVVYMAEQLEPVRRRVALKIIKLGMDTREVIARFDAERQALALMDHPNVARVLDAGSTASGRPFFVMELVRGLPITEFCDRHCLSTRDRVELFHLVCQAVQHAHSKGIIHRDLKPSNILVAEQDGRPVPKIIDFGIAKAVQQPLTEKTLFTRFGQMVGTPVYMSPEHLGGNDLDTRSDVYSLGVILYELLTGKQPFDLMQLRTAGYLEMMRIIQEEDPPPPSTRLTALGGELAEVAKHRNVNARRLSELLRGDLDWITMKALQKDRAHRYHTPIALAEDLQRHLNHQPVIASPPSFGYRTWKFVQRHRYGVAAATGILLALLAGIILSTYAFFRAREERERAVLAEHNTEKQRQVAVLQAKKALAKEMRARQISYDSDMSLASHALEVGNLGRVLSLLHRQVPPTGSEDLRDWEWRYLWQRCQSSELFQLTSSPDSVLSLAVSSDGRLAAVGDLGGRLAVWDLPARRLLWNSNSTPIMALSPDGGTLIDAKRAIRDAESGRVRGYLPGQDEIKKLEFSRDGQLLAGLVGMDRVCVWESGTWKLLGSYANYPCVSLHFGTVAFANNGEWILVGTEDGRLHQVNFRNGSVLRAWKAHPEGITAAAVSPDSKFLASASGYAEDEIKLWRSSEGGLEGVLKGHRAWITSLAFSPDGSLLASASADQNICIWEVSSQRLLTSLRGHLHEVWSVAFSPDGRSIISGGKDGSVKVWRTPVKPKNTDISPFQPGDAPTISEMPMEFTFTSDGQELLGRDQKGQVARWTLPSLRPLGVVPAFGSKNYVLASLPKTGWVVAVDEAGIARFWDHTRQSMISKWPLCSATNKVIWLGFVPGAHRLVSVLDYWNVEVWDLDSRDKVARWKSQDRRLGPLCVSPEGRYLVSGGPDVVVYDLNRGTVITNFTAHRFYTDAVAFSPDGKLLATGSQEGLARLWRTDTWQELGTLKGHLLGVHSLAFSPDGRRLATGSLGKEAVKLWDVRTLQEVLNLPSSGDLVWRMSFSPEGRTLVAMGSMAGVKCWSAPLLDECQYAAPTQFTDSD